MNGKRKLKRNNSMDFDLPWHKRFYRQELVTKMKNNGPVYNLTTGKINFPIDDRVAIDPEGHISYRLGDHTAISPMPPSSNQPFNYGYQESRKRVYNRPNNRNTGPSKAVMVLLQGIGVAAVIGVMAALYYYGFAG